MDLIHKILPYLLCLLLFSCEKEDYSFNAPPVIAFTIKSTTNTLFPKDGFHTKKSKEKDIKIWLQLIGIANTKAINIKIDVLSVIYTINNNVYEKKPQDGVAYKTHITNAQKEDYHIINNNITINANSYWTNLDIHSNNIKENKTIILKISEVSGREDLSISPIYKYFKLVLLKD